ncbi:cyclin domain protein [Trichuris suis]|nr:cyclin domain protein [Trichuris suis]
MIQNVSCPVQSDVEDLQEYLAILSKDNSKRVTMAKERRINRSFFDQRCVEFIFTVCDRFHFPPDVRYSTVCLFDAFMFAHVSSLWQYVDENCRTEESFLKDWNTVETKLSSQQLNVSSVKNFLQCMGFCYTEEQILKAELRVLKALDYDVNIQSPLTYLSTLLKLVAADVQMSNFQSIYNICLDILSFVFMKRDEIYDSLLLDPISEQERKHQIVVLEADYMLLACGVITSAVELSADQCNEHSILLSLSNRSSIPVEELKHFRANVKKCVIKSKQTVRTQETTHRRSTPSCKY